jgi:hypothetical protein
VIPAYPAQCGHFAEAVYMIRVEVREKHGGDIALGIAQAPERFGSGRGPPAPHRVMCRPAPSSLSGLLDIAVATTLGRMRKTMAERWL